MRNKNRHPCSVRLSTMGMTLITASVFGLFPVLVGAEELPHEAVLPVSLAVTAAKSAVEHCGKDGYQGSVAVVDRSGVLRPFLRADGVGPHTVEGSEKKAYTSASMRGLTGNVAELIAKTPALQGLQYMNDRILFLAGGLPIEIAGEIIGGIGVGGRRSARWHLDAACAQAGLDSIGAATKFAVTK
ncbi:MAG TPA: heme-binding protein [Nitrospiraceae bacterium]|nr:heme-binding protein [Nitrospiraceae bacterium]